MNTPLRVVTAGQIDHPRAPIRRGHPVILWRLNPQLQWERWEWSGGWRLDQGVFDFPSIRMGDAIVDYRDTWAEPYMTELRKP